MSKTIFIDASALVAMIAGEEGAAALAHRLDDSAQRLISPVARWEAIVALHRSYDYDWTEAQRTVEKMTALHAVRTVAIGEAEGQLALSAYGRYGKGNHPARLNMGDCFAYACAKNNDAALLYKGDDFARTDLA